MKTFKNFLLEAVGKKIIFIGSTFVGPEDDMKGYIQPKIKGSMFAEWDDIVFADGILKIEGDDLKTFDFIFVGPVGDRGVQCSCIRAYIEKHKIPSLFYGESNERNNKILQTVLMKNGGVDQIKTIIGNGKSLKAADLVKELKLPLVSKIIDGSQGRGVVKHDDASTLEKLLKKDKEKLYIFQEFIPNDGDYRIFFIKDELIYCILRKRKNEKEFRNNYSLGGSYEMIETPAKVKALAKKAVKVMNFGITGVDIVEDKDTKKLYVMEINSAPQFAGDEMKQVMDKIIELVQK